VNFQETAQPGAGPTASGGGFPIYSPLTGPPRNHAAAASTQTLEPGYSSDFSALQLLRVMSRLTQPGTRSLSYFMLCREFGVRAIDGMVRGRILDLRWMDPVTSEDEPEPGSSASPQDYSRSLHPEGGVNPIGTRMSMGIPSRSSIGIQRNASHSGTIIAADFVDVEEELIGMGDEEMPQEEVVFGPKVLPATPILRYAMASVVAEYEDTGSASEYASLSDVDKFCFI